MSNELKLFYTLLQAWIDADFPAKASEVVKFNPHIGLCGNMNEYCALTSKHSQLNDMIREMKQQFTDAGLSEEYPFNDGLEDYMEEEFKFSNDKRLAWIKGHSAP